MSCTSTFFTLYGELPATYQAGSHALLLSHSIKLEEIVFLWLKRQLITLWFRSLNTTFSSRNCWDGRYFFRKKQPRANFHYHVAEFIPQLGWRNRCLQGKIRFCLELSGVPPGWLFWSLRAQQEGRSWGAKGKTHRSWFKGGEFTALCSLYLLGWLF